MARLTRKNIKVFAGNATNNGVFGSLQAENPVTTTNVEQIQSLPAWSVGWNSATMTSENLPPLEEFQGIQYVTTYQQAYLMQEGMPEWASTVTYYKGSLAKEVTSNGFRIYCSLTNDNTNNLLSDTSNWKKVMDSENLYAFNNDVVHLTGNETISGNKTFTGNLVKQSNALDYNGIRIQNTLLTKGTAPSTNIGGQFVFQDKDGYGIIDRIGGLETTYDTNGVITTRILACEPVANSTTYASISVIYPASGNPYTYAPTPTDTYSTTSGTQIATTGWTASNFVNLAGAQSITGNKTFSGHVKLTERTDYPDAGLLISNNYPNYAISIQDTSCTKGTAPSSRKFAAIDFYGTKKDGYNDRLGLLECVYETNKDVIVRLGAYLANSASDTTVRTLDMVYSASGDSYATCPASDVNNSIVTTVNKTKAQNGYFKLGNGLIVQWGFSQASGTVKTVTLPTAFTTNNYSVVLTVNQNSANELFVQEKNSTSFTWNRYGGIGNNAVYWIAIGY